MGIVRTEKEMLWAQPKPWIHKAWVESLSQKIISGNKYVQIGGEYEISYLSGGT